MATTDGHVCSICGHVELEREIRELSKIAPNSDPVIDLLLAAENVIKSLRPWSNDKKWHLLGIDALEQCIYRVLETYEREGATDGTRTAREE